MLDSKIKILPHVLVRLGGMSFDVLEALAFSETVLKELDELERLEIEFSNYKADLLKELQTYSADFPHFKLIRKLKKVIHKEHLVTLDLFKVLNESIISNLLIFNNLINTIRKVKNELVVNFNIEYSVIQKQLQAFSTAENLQNALPLSSLVFAKQYLKYLEKTPTDFRKKEQQTQQSTFQYLNRTAAKTSPFSSFTPICYGKLVHFENENCFDTNEVQLELKRQLEWNNYLLELFKTAFQQHSEILPYLQIGLNTTIKSDIEQYQFLVNQQNIERFQILEKQAILEVFETILLSNKDLSIHDLINKLSEEIEADYTDLINFIEELIEIGFLEIPFSFHQKSSVWLEELMLFSNNIPILKQFGIPVFEQMKTQIKQFETADLKDRIHLLESSFSEIKLFLDFLNPEKSVDLKSIIAAEQLIYEDTAYQGLMKINASKTENLVLELNELLSNLNFIKGKERLQISYFFDNHYKPNESVPVLEFYENYYKNGKLQLEAETIESIETEAKLINNWVKSVAALLIKRYEKTGKVSLKNIDFQSINQALNISPIRLKNNSFACFAQLFEEADKLKAVLNAVSIGFGKMSGRFLDLMPNDFYEDLRLFNRDKEEQFIKVENTDAAFFNANNHQSLLDFELSNPNNHSKNSKNKQLKITDLFIKKVDNDLIIWHKTLKKQVHLYDLGIQTPKGRSPLYQLLLNFSPTVPSLHYLEVAFEKFRKILNLENSFLPTIFYENWVLKRASWKIPNIGQMESIRNIPPFETYQNWQKWKGKNNLINKKYYITNILNSNNQGVKQIKPIYMNFNNLMCLNNSFYQSTKVMKALQIEEMKPNNKELLKVSNQKYVSEFIIQWYNK